MPIYIEREYNPGQTQGPAGMGFAPPAANVPERLQTLPERPPGQPSSGPHTGYGGGPTAPPGQTQGPAGMGFAPPRQLSSGLHTGMGSGEFLSSRYGGGLDDAAGMNDGAMGMLEGAGFEVAGMTSDKRTEKKLWGLAVNSFPPGTPDIQIQQKWEELKQEFYRRKYGGGSDLGDLGLTLPGIDDIVGLG